MSLNQAHTGRKLVTLILKLSFVTYSCMHVCVCPPTRLLITSGVMWFDMHPPD